MTYISYPLRKIELIQTEAKDWAALVKYSLHAKHKCT